MMVQQGPPELAPHIVTPVSAPRLNGQISLGAILQILTVLGSACSMIFAAGSYVQNLRDTITIADRVREMQRSDENAILHQLSQRLNELPPRVPASH